MESIENIKSVYQRIEDEARCELNKVQQQIYRISTLRLRCSWQELRGYLFLDGKLGSADRALHLSPCCRSFS